MRQTSQASRGAGVFRDRSDLPLGDWVLRPQAELGAAQSTFCARNGACGHEQAGGVDALLPAARVLRRVRASIHSGALAGAVCARAAAVSHADERETRPLVRAVVAPGSPRSRMAGAAEHGRSLRDGHDEAMTETSMSGQPNEFTGMRAFVTGCAGFIGSTLTDRLLSSGCTVVGIDNFSTGQPRFLDSAAKHPRFRLVEADLLDTGALQAAMRGADCVFHLAANADVRLGTEHPRKDLEQNIIATHNVLESMRANGIRKIAFASTGSVYGEATVFPTPEDAPFPVQTSLYAASKLAGEGLVAAYAAGYGFVGVICRLVSILGERYTHGHLFDFYRALKRDPTRLRVLGDGRQEKSYLYVQDCIDGLLAAADCHYDEPGAHI